MTPTPSASTRRFAAATLCAGLLAAVALPGNRLGLGMVLVAALVLAAVVSSGALPRSRYTAVSLALAVGLAAMAALRDAAWLLWIDLAAATLVTVLAAGDARSWRALVRAPLRWMAKLAPAPLFVAWTSGVRPSARTRRHAAPIARGLALGWALVLVFGALFASADEAFAQLTDGVLTPDVNLGLLPARAGVLVAVVGICGAVVLVALAPTRDKTRAEAGERWSAEWLIALALLDALFVVFLVVQARILFGGNDHVLETAGLTYAEYAREGFYQLLVVAFLTLIVVAVAGKRRGRRSGRRPTPVELLLGLLCALTVVVLVSALRRLGLLEDTYGFTITRLLGHATTLWVGAVLALVAIAGALRRTEVLPRAIVVVSAAGILAFSLLNPEGLVAGQNVDRYQRTGKIDTGHLATLGPDATPALSRLPRRVAPGLVERTAGNAQGDGFFALNVGRARARAAAGDHD